MRTLGQLLDSEVADLVRKVDINNHIIPSYCSLPIGCRSLVDRCGSFRSFKPQIIILLSYNNNNNNNNCDIADKGGFRNEPDKWAGH